MKHSMMLVAALAALSFGAQVAAAADGKAVYEKSCKLCHKSGAMGAPKTGDKEKWAPLIKQGEDALVQAVVKGKGKMKPNAGNAALTVDEIKAANAYMIDESK